VIARLVFASLRRRPRQLVLIAAAILVAAATVATLAAFSARADRRLAGQLAEFGPNLVVRPQVGGAPELPPGAAAQVAAVPGVLAVTKVGLRGDRLDVRVEPSRLTPVARQIESRLEAVEAVPLLRTSESDARLTHRLGLVLMVVSAMSFVLALLSVVAATTALVGERRTEIGLMLALGHSSRRIGALLAVELLAAALVAALAGELLGEGAAGSLEHRLLGGAGGFVFTWGGAAAAAGVALLVVGASLAVALGRIEHLDTARVLRGE
jgi:predicted lysophospholipase L1 biosynthesis ABC-type transport system permease subunit